MKIRLPTLFEIEDARKRIDGVALRTPLVPLYIGEDPIFLKLENLQRFGSFKIRAATNAIKSLSEAELKNGVLTASAGNFGQGLASAAALLGVKCTVFVPDTAAKVKVEAMAGLGAHIHSVPFDAWWDILRTRVAKGVDGAFVHPVADPAVIAGNATIGAEILEDLSDVDTVLAPVGGGGLAAGIGAAVRALRPTVQILAAESEASRPVAGALAAGRPVEIDHRPSFIDGMGGRSVLEEMWPLLQDVLNGAVCSTLQEISEAIRVLFLKHHIVAEGAGAAPVAAAIGAPGRYGKTVCVVSGGNLDPSVLCHIMRGETPGSASAP